jgi:hypothetical protein
MNRFALSALAVLATSSLAVLPTFAQSSARAEDMSSSSAPVPVERAALDLSSSSSSSAYNLFESEAKSSSASAQAVNRPEGSTRPFSSVGVGFKIGIGGIGFDVATPLVPGRLNVRGGAGFFSYTYNGTINNEPVNANLKLNNAEVMVDFFPFKGSFRLSAGTTVYNTTGLNGTTTVAGGSKLTIGNNSYTSSPTNPLTANLAAGFGGKAVPRFSLGWGNMVPKTGHIRFETELGVEITGTPNAAWTYGGQACQNPSSGPACSSGYASISSIPGASADIAAQNASLQSDLSSVKVFPIFSLGLSYKIH